MRAADALSRVGASQWDYVTAAYALTGALTALVLVWAWRAMVRSERAADALRKDGKS